MTGDDKAGKAAKRPSQYEYLGAIRSEHFGPDCDVGRTPHNQSVVDLCDVLLTYSAPRTRDTPLPSLDEQLKRLREAKDEVEYFFMQGKRAALARLLSVAGKKLSALNRQVDAERLKAQGARLSTPLKDPSAHPLHGASRAEPERVATPAPALGLPNEWGAQTATA